MRLEINAYRGQRGRVSEARRLGKDVAQPLLCPFRAGLCRAHLIFGVHALRGFRRDVQDCDDAALLIANRTQREGEPRISGPSARGCLAPSRAR